MIIHRDLKPENLLLDASGCARSRPPAATLPQCLRPARWLPSPGRRVKITDFGLSKSAMQAPHPPAPTCPQGCRLPALWSPPRRSRSRSCPQRALLPSSQLRGERLGHGEEQTV